MNARSVISVCLLLGFMGNSNAQEPINIGSRRELFVDHHLIAKMSGSAKLHLHKPKPQEVALVADQPWEGNTSAYYTIFQDGNIYRMYFRGSHWDVKNKKAAHREVTCYAESKDGIRWQRPKLGLFAFNGSKDNNIVWDGLGTHNFAPFKDTNPKCAPASRYKALARGRNKYGSGLFAFQSADGIRWKMMSERPVITKGAFDSQNLAFWDGHAGLYREYHRIFVKGARAIMTGTSKDFLKWSDPVLLKYPGTSAKHLRDHLYTNAVQTYPRAPHILIGFPTRFHPNRGQQVEPTFMTSRDGVSFHRFTEPVIPVTAPKDRDGNRSNYMALGLVQLPGNDKEYSVYATEAYYTGPDSRIRRFTYRVDGFVSLRAGAKTGELITKPVIFRGGKLVVNMKSSEEGSVRVEIQNVKGTPFTGLTINDCRAITGDGVEQEVAWKFGTNVSQLTGTPIRLRFVLQNADLYSFRFVGKGKTGKGD